MGRAQLPQAPKHPRARFPYSIPMGIARPGLWSRLDSSCPDAPEHEFTVASAVIKARKMLSNLELSRFRGQFCT